MKAMISLAKAVLGNEGPLLVDVTTRVPSACRARMRRRRFLDEGDVTSLGVGCGNWRRPVIDNMIAGLWQAFHLVRRASACPLWWRRWKQHIPSCGFFLVLGDRHGFQDRRRRPQDGDVHDQLARFGTRGRGERLGRAQTSGIACARPVDFRT